MFRNSNKYQIIFFSLLLISDFSFAQNKKGLLTDLNLNIGLTSFSNPFRDDGLNNDMAIFAKAGNLGLEFYNEKANVSFEARKIYWLSVSASNFLHDINAWASYSQLGLTKYINLSKSKKLGINLSHVWVAENNYTESYSNPAFAPHQFLYAQFHTAKAISIAPSINLTERLNFELRANFYYFTRADSISKGINSNRLQFSLIYKINPMKK